MNQNQNIPVFNLTDNGPHNYYNIIKYLYEYVKLTDKNNIMTYNKSGILENIIIQFKCIRYIRT